MIVARASLVITLSLIGPAAIAQMPRDSIPATARARYDTAFHAWQAGEYPTALARLERIYVAGGSTSARARANIYALSSSRSPRAISSGPGIQSNPVFVAGGKEWGR